MEAPITPESPLLGGDRDEHGCIGSAGYSWCEAKAECLRPWEEQWDDSCGVVGGDPVGVVPPLEGNLLTLVRRKLRYAQMVLLLEDQDLIVSLKNVLMKKFSLDVYYLKKATF